MSAALGLLTLYVTDLEASRRFYTTLGLSLVAEQHDTGPLHYAAALPGGGVLELYPTLVRPPTRVRLGFAVDDVEGTVDALAAAGWPPAAAVAASGARLVRGPDGNAVELTAAG